MGSTLVETTLFLHFSHELYCVWHTAKDCKLRQRNEDRQCGPLLAPPCAWGDCALAHASGVVAGLAQTFRPRRACVVEGWTPSGHTRLLPASRLTVAPGRCMYSQQSGQQSATLRIRALPVPVDRLCLRLSSASGCAHRKNGDLRTFYALAASWYRHAT